METEPGVLFDALVLPAGNTGVAALMKDGRTLEFIRDQYRHGKTILALSGSGALLESAGGFASLPSGGQDPGIVSGDVTDIDALVAGFIKAVARHRHPERETDPPLV